MYTVLPGNSWTVSLAVNFVILRENKALTILCSLLTKLENQERSTQSYVSVGSDFLANNGSL